MPGFIVTDYKTTFEISDLYKDKCINESLKNNDFIIKRNTLNKFLGDKVFEEREKSIIITEGVILNKLQLMEKYGLQTFPQTIEYMYANNGETFFDEFRGSFSGGYFDKEKGIWLFYTNQIGDKPLFYYKGGNNMIAASSVNYIIEVLKSMGISYSINEKAVYDVLTYGFMASGKGNDTLVEGVLRLKAGTCLKYDTRQNKTEFIRYRLFTNTKLLNENLTEDDIIEELDVRFREAVALEFEKDKEYGYISLASLSGGLDSRMTTWVAKRLNYDMLNVTFSQNGYLDEKIAKKIVSYLGNEWIFKSLDDAKFLKDIDNIIEMNYGLSQYMGISHGNSLGKYLNFDNIGIWHTGQLGDVIIGSYSQADTGYKPIKEIKRANSTFLADRIDRSNFNEYENEEMFILYTRGLGILCSQLAHTNYTEMMSPFLDVDFLEFCLSIPLKFREGEKLYQRWVIKKYPDAAGFKWERINSKITDPEFIRKLNQIRQRGPYKLARILGLKFKKLDLYSSMNPLNYWYATNRDVREFMDNYFHNGMKELHVSNLLRTDMVNMYEKGNVMEKTQVLTAISGIRRYQLS